MKILLATLMLSATLFSCGKSGSHEPDLAQTYPVSLKVKGFEQKITDFNSQAAPNQSRSIKSSAAPSAVKSGTTLDLSADIKGLTYVIYDFEGNYLRHTDSNREDTGYGNLNEMLPYGLNTIVVIGYTNRTVDVAFDKNINDKTSIFTHEDGDFVFNKIEIDVIPGLEGREIDLNRAVAKMKFDITDETPDEVTSITFKLETVFDKTTLTDDMGTAVVKTYTFDKAAIAAADKEFIFYTFANDEGHSTKVEITTVFNDGKPNNVRLVPMVNFRRNTQTVMSGSLFGTMDGSWIESVEEWAKDINDIF